MPKARQAKPEKDQAATEIANEEETRAASVTDGEGGPELVSREEIEETAEALIDPEAPISALYSTMDAQEWAEEFVRIFPDAETKDGRPIDVGLMQGWFANAIMVGYDEGQRKQGPPTTPPEEATGEVIDLLDSALAELGEPDGSYPAPVVNAIEYLRQAKAAADAAGIEVVGTLERAIEVELFSPGEVCPTSGLWRPVGSESALSKGDRFPPPSMAVGWMLMEAAEQKGRGS